jgi:imidazole glycerol-phosphate synthase subunit HisH
VVEATVAACDYGNPFSATVEQGNLFGVQFHPEKSGEAGLLILENFCTC